ncbi:MAG: transcriptional regulator, MarR family, DNA processing protein [Candidatus Curtissbacteria bacterium GW2011_GWC1_44_33]|uniref:Transcriptional regulator, MarR family, DNA processing protein n=2 Tax=Microgenomates group TaxID=1794810 RepID=A0A0G1LAF0_9BACT|nr:MAG: transcriptional regulator, MarR family, DNA processing protein [Candidatus Curtissbacteria bacterium GW2011_GWC1_44_33]
MKISDFEIQKVALADKNYPALLKKIKNPPKQIYFRGDLRRELFKKSLAVVGSRRMTRYGGEVIEKFIPALVGAGVTIISGFMYGVDTEAHTKTVESGGRTVAVLGNGINICYPPEVIMSEYEPDQKAQLWMYSARNRIVAGLSSLGVLIIEAGEASGSLITARLAKEQGKKVFAVPGPISSPVSQGTNLLIKKGEAKTVTDPADILGTPRAEARQTAAPDLDGLEKKIYLALKLEPLTVDEIVAAVGEDVVEISKSLSLMSLKGLIGESGGKFFLSSS